MKVKTKMIFPIYKPEILIKNQIKLYYVSLLENRKSRFNLKKIGLKFRFITISVIVRMVSMLIND